MSQLEESPLSLQTQAKLALPWMLGFLFLELFLYLFVDRPLASLARELDSSAHGLIAFFRKITDLGKGCWYLWPCGVATIFCAFLSRGREVPPRYRDLFGYIGVRAFFLFCTIGLSGLIANVFKPLLGRARPPLLFRDQIFGFDPFTAAGYLWNSMPSGHATTAFALAFGLTKLYPQGKAAWFAYAFLLALSRIMVNAHYLSDVCAGAALGMLTVWAFEKYGMKPLSKVIFPIDTAILKL